MVSSWPLQAAAVAGRVSRAIATTQPEGAGLGRHPCSETDAAFTRPPRPPHPPQSPLLQSWPRGPRAAFPARHDVVAPLLHADFLASKNKHRPVHLRSHPKGTKQRCLLSSTVSPWAPSASGFRNAPAEQNEPSHFTQKEHRLVFPVTKQTARESSNYLQI